MVFMKEFSKQLILKKKISRRQKSMNYFPGCKALIIVAECVLFIFVSLPRGAVGRSMVCVCGISSSKSLDISY